MKTVALIGQKGGTGKTTLSTCLAVAAYLNGGKTSIIDLDPQVNACNWFERREIEGPEVASLQPGALSRGLETARSMGMDWVFIDTPGKMDNASTAAARHADIVLIPSQAQVFSAETLEPLKILLEMAGHPPAYVVLNEVNPNAHRRNKEDAAAIEQGYGLKVAPIFISERAVFGEAPSFGLSPQEMDPKSKASMEIVALFRFLENLAMQITTGNERKKA